MTPQQARRILFNYRPWAKESPAPDEAAALALCRQDAELAHWFANHCAVQTAIHGRFNQIAVPEGLKEQILSEWRARKVVLWWQRPVVLAAAASLAILVSLGSLWLSTTQPKEDVSYAAYRSRMIRTAVKAYGMDLETNDVTQIRAYLAQNRAPADFALPRNLDPAASVGCGVLSWQGKPVTMVCFRTGKPLAPGTKSDLFLFVIDQKDLKALPRLAQPEFANVSTMATASWSEGGKVYVLAAPDESELKKQL